MNTWGPTKDRRIKKRGDWYWARFKKRGVLIQESLSTQSFETAKRMVEEIENCILLGVDWRKEHELFETAWPEFLADKARGNKTRVARESTLSHYVWFGDHYYMPHLKDLRLSQIDDVAWTDMVTAIKAEKPDMLFFNLRKYLLGFLSWAKRKGKIRESPDLFDPDQKAKADRESAGPGKAYTLAELSAMREAAATIGGPFYLFVIMAQFMGMRPSEINQLKKDRIDLAKGVIALRKADTKTHRARLVPIHPGVLAELLTQIMRSTGSAYLFPNHRDQQRPMDQTGFKKRWAEVLEKSGLEGRFYDFRHTFITNALNAGSNPVAVAEMTGTSISVIQKHYLHLNPDDLIREIKKVDLSEVIKNGT